jgi:hypothetical protein
VVGAILLVLLLMAGAGIPAIRIADGPGAGPGNARAPSPIPSTPALATGSSPAIGLRNLPAPALPNPLAVSPRVDVSFDGLALGDNAAPLAPPDPILAVGPSQVVEMVNLVMGIYTKQGALVSKSTLSSLFGTSTHRISDPKVQYDSGSGRWFATITDVDASVVRLAVSASSDAHGSWKAYSLADTVGNDCLDQPILAVGGDKVVVSVNAFSSCTVVQPTYLGAEWWALTKADLVAWATSPSKQFFPADSNLVSVHPAQGSDTTVHMVSVNWTLSTTATSVILFRLTGLPPSAHLSRQDVSIRQVAVPPSAPQLGSTKTLDTGDIRVQDASSSGGKLWLSLDTGCVPVGDAVTRACGRIVEIDLARLATVQDFDIAAPGKYYFYPALRIDGLGDLFVSLAESSASVHPSVVATARVYGDVVNTYQPIQTIRTGSGPETVACNGSVCRYGDYFGAATDPANPLVLWGVGEYGTGSGWGTHVFSARVKAILEFGYTVLGGGQGYSAPILSYVDEGANINATLSTTPASFAADPGTDWNVPPFLNGTRGNESWAADEGPGAPFWSQLANRSLTITWRYFHQFVVVFDYSIVGVGQPGPPHVTFTSFGIPTTGFAQPTLEVVDAGSTYAYAATINANSRVRYAGAGPLVGTIATAVTISVPYYAQYSVTFNSAFLGGSPGFVPDVTFTSFGAPIVLPTNATVWVDSDTPYSYNASFPGAAAGVRWAPRAHGSGTISFSTTINVTYGLQYLITVVATPSGAESLIAGAGWYDAGTYTTLFVLSSTKWRFSGWSGAATGPNLTLLLRVDQPLVIQATFDPGLTVTAGAGGSVTYTYGSQGGTVPAGNTSTIFVPAGTTVTLTEHATGVADAFSGWSGNAAGTDPSISVKVEAPMTVVAAFGPNVVVLGGVSALVILGVVLVAFLVAARRRGRHPPV